MDDIQSFHNAVVNAKNFENFEDVLMAVSLNPEWLTKVPERRSWAILHHIVYSGNIDHLDQLLALQKTNSSFRLLSKAADGKNVLDIARLREDDEPKMFARIERLAKLDELLNYAKDTQWHKCYEIVHENPSYGNEKPPYRRYYLIHHMACANDTKEFEEFQKIKNFKFNVTLRADRKKINEIAREAGCNEFAEYIEEKYPSFLNDDDDDDKLYEPSKESRTQTSTINTLMEHRNVLFEPDMLLEPLQNVKVRGEVDKSVAHKLSKQPQPRKILSKMDQVISERPTEAILDILTCSLTRAIVTDPVVAADGFTYERTAIEVWLKSNDHSPMTNEKLPHKNLNPNFVVKQILEAITQK